MMKREYHLGNPRDAYEGPVEKAFRDGGLTLEHINVNGEGPLTFKNKSELKDYCKRHNVASGALL